MYTSFRKLRSGKMRTNDVLRALAVSRVECAFPPAASCEGVQRTQGQVLEKVSSAAEEEEERPSRPKHQVEINEGYQFCGAGVHPADHLPIDSSRPERCWAEKFELPGCRKVHSNRALRQIDRSRETARRDLSRHGGHRNDTKPIL
jgi:hypothetical protein